MDLDQGESIRCFQELMSSCKGEDHLLLRKIAQLDIKCENVCHDFDKMAAQLIVESAASSDQQVELPDQTMVADNNNVEFTCTKNIHLLRGAWAHVLRLDDCAKIHHRNAANYHQVYFEIGEYDRSMEQCLPKILAEVAKHRKESSVKAGETLLQLTKNVAFALKFFQGKVYEVYERSRVVVPVYKRTDGSADGIPVTALCAFQNKQVEIRQGDHLTLLKNQNVNVWTVKNGSGQVGDVPSPIVLIPPPDSRAVDAAFQLQLKLLGHWVTALKILGKSILPYMDGTLSELNKQKPDILKDLPTARKQELQQVLRKAQKNFSRIWAKHPSYIKMTQEGAKLSGIMKTSNKGKGSTENQVLKQTTKTMGGLEATYRELLDMFAQFAMWVRIGTMPERLLMVKGWEDFKLESLDDLVGKWQDYVLESISSDEDDDDTKMATTRTEDPPAQEVAEVVSDKVEEKVTCSESCQQMKYVICGAPDPWGGDDLDFETACKKGIINMERGLYYNPKTGERKSLGQAMAEGQVNVEVQ